MSAKGDGRKRFTLSAFSILLILLISLSVITVAMSAAGVHGLESATIANVVTAPVSGFIDAIEVCLFVMVLGGFLGVVNATGALDAGIAALVRKLKGNELILIPILMFIFSIGGTTYGMCEETVPFYLLMAATMVAAGFDSMVGISVVLLGAGCGVLGSTVNPFAVGVATSALAGVGVPFNNGVIMLLGVILWLVSLGISIFFVMRYAKKVKADKGSTILSLQEREVMIAEFGEPGAGGITKTNADDGSSDNAEAGEDAAAPVGMTGRQKATLITFGITFIVMILGLVPWPDLGVGVFEGWSAFLTGLPLGEWYFNETSAWFLIMAIVIGVIGGVSESRFVKAFITGTGDMMSVVLVIALARSITVLMGETGIDRWILTNAANALQGLSALIFAPMSYLLFVGLSFLIPSSSGMATVAMPIMGTLADGLGFSPDVMVMIFSGGNGLVNLFTPTCGAIMGGLAIAKVEYTTWLKFGAKLFVAIGLACMVILTVAMLVF